MKKLLLILSCFIMAAACRKEADEIKDINGSVWVLVEENVNYFLEFTYYQDPDPNIYRYERTLYFRVFLNTEKGVEYQVYLPYEYGYSYTDGTVILDGYIYQKFLPSGSTLSVTGEGRRPAGNSLRSSAKHLVDRMNRRH